MTAELNQKELVIAALTAAIITFFTTILARLLSKMIEETVE